MEISLKWILAATPRVLRILRRHANLNTVLLLVVVALVLFSINIQKIAGLVDIQSCASNHLSEIEWTISEKDKQHFVEELHLLYLELEQCGLKVPMLDPVSANHQLYNETWHGYHLTFLKALHRKLTYRTLNAAQWNADVERENAERVTGVAEQ